MEVAVPEGARKRSWSELKQLLKEIRLNAAIIPRSVTDVKFRAVAGGRIRIYFISSPLPGKGNTIMSADISVSKDCEGTVVRGGNIQWTPLLDPTFQTSLGASKCSKQEMSMFDRKRIMSWGISSYELHPSGRILFPSGDRLFHCPSADDRVGLYPLEIPLAGHAASNAEMCPSNPDLIAYVFEGDIWVQHLMGDESELPKRMTFCASVSNGDKRDRTAGYPSFVMQEEFDRYHGFWWQPAREDAVYRILYEEVDETNVETYTFGCAMNSEDTSESYKFPRSGTANAKSALKMIEFRLEGESEGGNRRVRICDAQNLTLERSFAEDFPGCEYVVRVGWTREGDHVWARLLDRPQRRMQTVVIPVSAFCRTEDADDSIEDHPVEVPAEVDGEEREEAGVHLCQVSSSSSCLPPPPIVSEAPGVMFPGHTSASSLNCKKAGILEVLLQTAPHWLNVDDVMFWFPRDKPTNDFRFIYASEETGYRHLYVASVRSLSSNGDASSDANDCHEDERDDDMQGTEENNSAPSPSTLARCRKRKVLDHRSPPPRRSCSCRPTGNSGDDGQDEDALDEEGMAGWRSGSRGVAMALTWGLWEVSEGNVWVDLRYGIVYFTAYRDTPLEKHLYAVALDEPGRIRRLTTLGFSHTVSVWVPALSADPSEPVIVVDVFSNTSTPPLCQVCRVARSSVASPVALAPATRGTVGVVGSSPAAALLRASGFRETIAGLGTGKVDQLILLRVGYIQGPDAVNQFADPTYEPPEIFSHRIRSGEVLHGMLFKPPNVGLGKKYPTLLTVYGGPKAQMVTNSFKSSKQSRNHILAAMGYCVVCVDGRGSEHRGHEFETHLYRRLGTVEMKDQVEVLTWLASVKGFIDMNRLAVHGWSYGGYLSLSALIRYPEVFRIAIAAAPVTCWHLYDTAYTERYMDFPIVNSPGYKEGSILCNAHKLPDEENRLLIIHGLMDDNVHFSHTTQLIDALVKAGKPYQLLVYPGERHSLRHYRSNEHYEVSVLSFLEQHL